MDENKKYHLWIPDEEVQQVPKSPTSRTTPRDIVFAEHGRKLSAGLQMIKQRIEETTEDNSLADSNLYVFKVELPEGEKVQYKSEIFIANGMQVNAVKDERNAVVSTTKQQFQILKNRVDAYTHRGTGKTHFDYIGDFKPYTGSEKNSNELKRTIYLQQPPETIDIQLMFVPNLSQPTYENAVKKVVEKIEQNNGQVQETPYYLSDNTPVIRAIIPSAMLGRYENDPAIYRIEETHFFSADADDDTTLSSAHFDLDDGVNISSLPMVVVLDSGVIFNAPIACLVMHHWLAPASKGGDCDHGSKVASRIAFNYLGGQLLAGKLTPRARVIDCNILDGSVPENVFIKRIQAAVNEFADIAKIFNLSANTNIPIEGDEMSLIGYELDAIQLRKNVQFVVSAGNHKLWQTETSIEDILDDDDSRISSPADSMLSIVVGSVVGKDHRGSVASKNIIAPYSRRGPGFAGFSKPDLSAYGGTIVVTDDGSVVPDDEFSLVMTKDGYFVPDAGTSFTAPIVAGDLADVLSITPDENILLAKALLYHNAKPIWEEDDIDDDELAFAHNLYGKGISSVSDSKFSSPSRVTFVRTGTLNRLTKERVKIYMPSILAAQTGRNVAKVTVTCVSMPPVDRTKGNQYLGAYIRASLKKFHPDGKLLPVQQVTKEGRKKWDVSHQFSKTFSQFNAGDWQVWLELFSRWDDGNVNVPYALVVTIEDVSRTLDVYSEIEALNRYRALNTIRIKVNA